MCDTHLVICLAKKYTQQISHHRDTAHRPTERNRSMCDMHLVIFWPRVTRRISHIDASNRSMCDRHLVICLAKSYKPDIEHRPIGRNRSMCDTHFVFFLAKMFTKRISHIDQSVGIGRCAIRILYFFLAKRYTKRTSHRRPTERHRSMCDTHIVICLVKKYTKQISHTSTERNRSMCDTHLVIFWPSLCIPNEDLGKRNRRSSVSFRGTLRGCEYSIWATNARQIARKDTPELLTHNGYVDTPEDTRRSTPKLCEKMIETGLVDVGFKPWHTPSSP